MERAQAKGEVAEAELRALEMDVTGKVSSLAYPVFSFSWSSRLCSLPGAVHVWKLFKSSARYID